MKGSLWVVQRFADDDEDGWMVRGNGAGVRSGKSRHAALCEWIDAGRRRRRGEKEGKDGVISERMERSFIYYFV